VPALHAALQAVSDTVARGGRVLFVGTKEALLLGEADGPALERLIDLAQALDRAGDGLPVGQHS
jgi:hypothetical protein